MAPAVTARSWRSRVVGLLAEGEPATLARTAATTVLLLTIAAAVAVGMLDTLPGATPAIRRLIEALLAATLVVFTAEYALRLWIAPDSDPTAVGRPWAARAAYAVSFLGVIDFLAILPRLLHFVQPLGNAPENVIGLLVLLKLARYAPGLSLIATVIRNELRSLVAALVVMLVLLILASGIMYLLERTAQPQVFSSIPRALWWGIVTIATVGYGDMMPVTPLGRLFGGVVMLLGIAMFAVPAGILATGFAAEIRKRDFVVTWQAVTRVPLFAGLDASQVAEIARLLKPQWVPARYLVVRRGDAADAMYFILAGEVEVELPQPVRLRAGQYFGEIGLVKDITRTATVTAVTECQLLALDIGDFRRLMQQYPELDAKIRAVAESRLHPRAGGTP